MQIIIYLLNSWTNKYNERKGKTHKKSDLLNSLRILPHSTELVNIYMYLIFIMLILKMAEKEMKKPIKQNLARFKSFQKQKSK